MSKRDLPESSGDRREISISRCKRGGSEGSSRVSRRNHTELIIAFALALGKISGQSNVRGFQGTYATINARSSAACASSSNADRGALNL